MCHTAVNSSCTATDFWKGWQAGYPLLSKVALDLLSTPLLTHTLNVCSVNVEISLQASTTEWPEEPWMPCIYKSQLEIHVNSKLWTSWPWTLADSQLVTVVRHSCSHWRWVWRLIWNWTVDSDWATVTVVYSIEYEYWSTDFSSWWWLVSVMYNVLMSCH